MDVQDLTDLGVVEAVRAISRREVSPVEVTQATLDRIARVDPKLTSYITVMADQALEDARRAELVLQGGIKESGSGLMAGAPISIKDLYETAGVRTTAGSKFFADNIPTADAEAVQRVRQAGAVVLGKTNMHEIALGLTTVNPHYGVCHNPWKLSRVVGGSSGGSAAALAARLCAGSLGSDTGGSIRVPAALCGVVGLKPTHGRISLRGVIPLSWNLDHAGPMARQVRDVALLLQVLAGYDPDDPYSFDVPVDDYLTHLDAGVGGMRLALAGGDYFEQTHPAVKVAVEQAARDLASSGAAVDVVEIPGIHSAALANGMMTAADAAAFHHERLLERPNDFGSDVLYRLRGGEDIPKHDYILARRRQTLMRRQFKLFFEQFDGLLLPTTPVTAPPIEGPDAVELARLLTRYTAPFNLTGLPALSLPCGFDDDGLPIGLQVVGPAWGEKKVLQIGYAYEQVHRWDRKQPLI